MLDASLFGSGTSGCRPTSSEDEETLNVPGFLRASFGLPVFRGTQRAPFSMVFLFEPVQNNLADLTAQSGDLAAALNLAKKAVALEPENSRYLDTLGWIAFQMADLDQAETSLAKAQSLSPKVAVINYHLGKVYVQRGEKEKAKQFLQLSLETPSAPWAEEVKGLLGSMN